MPTRGASRAAEGRASVPRASTPLSRILAAGRRLARRVWPPNEQVEKPEPPNPHVRLAELIVAGHAGTAEAVSLFLQAGLQRRALAAAERLDPSHMPPRTRMALAVARQDVVAIERELQRAVPVYRAGGPSAVDALLSAEAALPAAPHLALRWFDEVGLVHPARELYGHVAHPTVHRAAQPSPHEQRWVADALLVQANRRPTTADKLSLLNDLLHRQGSRPVMVRDLERPLTIDNLTSEMPPRGTAEAPLVSVIVTCYDNAQLLRPSLESLRRQTYRQLELIVVDDASRDDTPTILREMGVLDSRIKVLHLQVNVGTYAAKNAALAMASGEFVAFHDADDWSHPERIEQAVAALTADPRRVAVSSLYTRLDPEGRFVSNAGWPLVRWTPNSIVLRRRPVLERIGYFDEHRFGSDSEYVGRLRAGFGEVAHHKVRALALLASHRAGSLMTAPQTGVDAQGRSVARRRYEERWSEALLERLVRRRSLHRERGESSSMHADMERSAPAARPD